MAAPYCCIFIAIALCLALMTMQHCAISLAETKFGFAVTCANTLYNKTADKMKHFSIVEIYAVVAKLLACLFFFCSLKEPRKHYPEALN